MTSTDDADWYEVVEGESLMQGDIIMRCPVPQVRLLRLPMKNGDEVQVKVETRDLVVLSQSCDLEQNKVDEVLLAEVHAWEAVRDVELAAGNVIAKGKKFRQAIVRGNIPGYSLLKQRHPDLPWSIADLHQLHVLPKDLVVARVRDAGPRLRLRPPYREHLSQAFARFYMRVGLPHDAKEFEEEG